MIDILFFARLREALGTDRLQWSVDEAGDTVQTLEARLRAQGDAWDEALGADNIVCAVNQVQASPSTAIGDGDEVAFFPPVTGG